MGQNDIGYESALQQALENVSPMGEEVIPIDRAAGRIVSQFVYTSVDSPSVDVSFKDGYGVVSDDLVHACPKKPVTLKIVGQTPAGEVPTAIVTSGAAVRILSGAALPSGADAVLADEFVIADGNHIHAATDAEPGRNILKKGCDVCCTDIVAEKGDYLTPQARSNDIGFFRLKIKGVIV